MKKIRTITAGILGLLLVGAMSSCSSPAEGDKAEVKDKADTVPVAAGKELNADLAASNIGFIGYGVGKNHPGLFNLKSGSVKVDGGKLTGGKFVIDINSMKMEQTEDYITGKLRPHLLSADFFEAEKYPEASFEITAVEPFTASGADTSVVSGANSRITGNLTLKSITKSVSFPARVDVSDAGVSAAANFSIDRTQWEMRYGNDKTLKDKFISELVTIKVNLSAR